MSASVSTRRSASSGEPAWTVDSEPSWPLDIALSMSSASAPRTSPTTIRSGRMRSALRTSRRTVTSPRPSSDAGPRLEAHDVGVAQAQLGGVLDGDDPLAVADELRQRVERRRLARAGAAADEDVAAREHRALQQVAQRRRPGAVGDEVVGTEAARAEAADRQDRAVERERRDDDVHPRAVGQARVAQRLGLVDAPPERREDPLDRVAQVGLAVEAHAGRLDPAAALDPHLARPVDHHLVDGGIAEQRLQRPEPERALRDARHEPAARRRRRAGRPRGRRAHGCARAGLRSASS